MTVVCRNGDNQETKLNSGDADYPQDAAIPNHFFNSESAVNCRPGQGGRLYQKINELLLPEPGLPILEETASPVLRFAE